MSHGPYIETRDSPTVAPEPGALGPREKSIPRRPDGSRVPGWDTPADLTKDPATVPDPATTIVPDHLRIEIEGYLARYPDPRSAIIPALWAAQRLHHWCSPEAVRQVGAVLQRTPAELMAVATFYDQFETEPVGKSTIYVCTNISCSLRGADALLHEFERESTGRESEFHVRGFECLGACDIAPMVSIDGLFIGPIDLDEVAGILEAVAGGRTHEIFPERQINHMKVADRGAGDTPSHGAAGPSAVLAEGSGAATSDDDTVESTEGDATPDKAGASAGADPRRYSSPTQPSSDPNKDDATEDRATGQDPEDDSL
ncbi:MAG: NAD(P)H-dependent oxidoreductase subunit E [Solirubrobacteraceae bacterium]|nr:NAD(P)H-dependent oxidoreductase subunit E [Solirubrobacteraceae bacterium]